MLVEVPYKDQGLGPKVDFCFFKQVVFFHLDQMTKPKVNPPGGVRKPQPRAESYQTQKRRVPSPTRERSLLPVNASRYKPLGAVKVTFYFHSLCFSAGEAFFFSLDLT